MSTNKLLLNPVRSDYSRTLMPAPLEAFKQYYQAFDRQLFDDLDQVYSDNVVFSDPVHEIQGLNTLKQYFKEMCGNLTDCQFEFVDEVVDENSACFKWEMHYRHPSIKRNKPLTLTGISLIKFSDKVEYHEDFYDMGAMLYEHIPVLGSAVRMIKSRLAKESSTHNKGTSTHNNGASTKNKEPSINSNVYEPHSGEGKGL